MMLEYAQSRLEKLLSDIFDVADFDAIVAATLKSERRVVLAGLSGASRSFLVAALWRRFKRPIMFLVANDAMVEDLTLDLKFFHSALNSRPTETVSSFPAWETDPYAGLNPHADSEQARAKALWRLRAGKTDLVVASIRAIGSRLAAPGSFDSYSLEIRIGDELSQELMLCHLATAGYIRQEPVTSVGEFSQRGGIVDVFSPLMADPVRIEFFGDTIDSIREFSIDTQRSQGPINRIDVLPMKEHLITPEMYRNWGLEARKEWIDDSHQNDLGEKLVLADCGQPFPGASFVVPGLYPLEAVITDYDERVMFILDEPELLEESYGKFFEALSQRYTDSKLAGGITLPPGKLFLPPAELTSLLEDRPALNLEELGSDSSEFLIVGQPSRRFHGRIREMAESIRQSFEAGKQVVLLASTVGMAERFQDVLQEYELPFQVEFGKNMTSRKLSSKAPIIAIGHLSAGFNLRDLSLEIFSETDILDQADYFGTIRQGKKISTFMSDLQDLKEGQYVVHVDHGIARYGGIKILQDRECMILNYTEGDRLYVPLERLDLVQKYSAHEESKPKLDRLGGTTWVARKARVQRAIRDMAADLLKLYAERKVAVGHSFSQDSEWQKELEEAFHYEETPDQLSAIAAIKKDMESQVPMDRLVCGDVGYGKTEVGMRAVFKAVCDNKQVAMLAPTTVLCFQHYETLKERFAAFPVVVSMLSRFVSSRDQKRIIGEIDSGQVDVVVGTHRLLSKDVNFHDLGLVIVDEEQRFGVAHKEQLKRLKKEVDVLMMTATPIPRTLHMALTGLRDMSVIETPPRDRLVINTTVMKFNPTVIQNAIDFELERGGQVYFVHNRVESIYSLANFVQRICPKARIEVGHGQMKEKDLERVMLRFIRHEFDVLVSTAIIENGLDIPAANTMLVNRADQFGLAQLYQLRGRVGRSNRRAFAYLLIPTDKKLSPIARRRLAAIREFSELGAGFRIAALDLELRGAGSLLGGQQHGHIEAVGFDLYCQMLERTMDELRTGEAQPDVDTSINLQADLKLPAAFVADQAMRLWIYKNVASSNSEEEIDEKYRDLEDRFGELPSQAHNILEYARLRVFGRRLGIHSINRKRGHVDVVFHEDVRISPDRIVQLVEVNPEISFIPSATIRIKIPDQGRPVFEIIQEVLRELS